MQTDRSTQETSRHAGGISAEHAAFVPKGGHYPTSNDDPMLPDTPVPAALMTGKTPKDVLLSDEAVQAVKNENTKRNLQSNYWFEMSAYLRWGSTASLIGGLALVGKAVATTTSMSAALAAASTAITLAPVILAFSLAAVLATATVLASKHSKQLFIERSFDVQDFQMQRQAALVGQSIQQAVESAPPHQRATQWTSQFTSKAGREIAPKPQPELFAERVDASPASVIAR